MPIELPSDKLPFLFVVYALTWAVFFIYILVLSRRQQEIEQELKILRRRAEEKKSTGGLDS